MARLYEYARETGSGTAFGRVGSHVARDPDTVLAPDASYFPTGCLGGGPMPRGYLPFAPDVAVELRWPGDRKGAEAARVALLLGAGVRLVWYVEPAERRATIHAPGAAPEPLGEGGLLDGRGVVPGFACPLRDALDW